MDIYLVCGCDAVALAGRLDFLKSAGAKVFSSPTASQTANEVAGRLSLDSQVIGLLRFNGSGKTKKDCNISSAVDIAEYLCCNRPAVLILDSLPRSWLDNAGVPSDVGREDIVQLEYDGDLRYVRLL